MHKTDYSLLFSWLLIIFVLLFLTMCTDPTDNNKLEPEILLTLEKTPRLTECALKIEIINVNLPQLVSLIRDRQPVNKFYMASSDTVIKDNNLKPQTLYNYRAFLVDDATKTDSSALLEISTMDTTEHDITWTTYQLGYSSSYLYDVFALSENDVYTVGHIATDSGYFNAAHWDGDTWKIFNIETEYKGNMTSPPLKGIFGFSESDLWASSGLPKYYNGEKWTLYHLWDLGVLDQDDGDVSNIWGTSSSNMYFAGTKGTLVHYDGVNWTKFESGTELAIHDLCGFSDGDIFAVSGQGAGKPNDFLIYKDQQFIKKIESTVETKIGIWGTDPENIYAVGEGVFHFQGDSLRKLDHPNGIPLIFMTAIRGTAENSFYIVGSFGLVIHFNGSTWRYFPELLQGNSLYSLSVINDEVFAVGNAGIIYHGRK